ncbi:MAG: hypothetical protein Kow0098_27530 [Ignavibacteriaceae bacterium]
MKNKSILIIIVLTTAIIYPQTERAVINTTEFGATSYLESTPQKTLLELRQKINSLSDQYSVNLTSAIAPPAKWNPNAFNYISIAWGGFMIYFWALEGGGATSDAEKIVYGGLGAAFIIYGIIGSFDWE